MVELPLDVIEHVLEELRYSTGDLATCSLVCRVWKHLARRLLFRKVKLNKQRTKKFMESDFFFLPYVHHLELQGWSVRYDELFWFGNVTSLSLVVMPLCWCYGEAGVKSHSRFHSQFRHVVRLYIDRPRVDDMAQLARTICAFPCLETLTLDVFFTPSSDLPSFESSLRFPSTLKTVVLLNDKMDDVLRWLLSAADHLALRSLHLHDASYAYLRILEKLLPAFQHSLEDLSIPFAASEHNISNFIIRGHRKLPESDWRLDLSKNTSLRSLTISIFDTIPKADYNQRIVQTLSAMVDGQLEELLFDVSLEFSSRLEGLVDWSEVDSFLAAPQFSLLRRLEICLVRELHQDYSPNIDEDREFLEPFKGIRISEFPDMIYSRFPKCRARGILHVHRGLHFMVKRVRPIPEPDIYPPWKPRIRRMLSSP